MVDVRPDRKVRFNVLLTEDRERGIEHWTRQLPRLLEPQGFHAYVARTGREALEVAGRNEIHAAVIDLLTPSEDPARGRGEADGLWLMQLLHRLPRRPPVVLVGAPPYGPRQVHRLLNEALRLGVFSVVNRPVELEAMLEVIRRLIDRRYAGTWPPSGGGAGDADRGEGIDSN